MRDRRRPYLKPWRLHRLSLKPQASAADPDILDLDERPLFASIAPPANRDPILNYSPGDVAERLKALVC